MRRAVFALLLVLPACLEYEIAVTTVVRPDGTITRKVAIRTRNGGQPGRTWRRLGEPRAPYKLEGDPETGFVATAQLKPGRHPTGLRILLGGLGDDDDPPPGDVPVAEGTADIRCMNLIVGTLYRYEEHVALGVDPVRFQEELPRWLDTGLSLLLDALKLRFPDIDFGPVDARAREDLLPAVQHAIERLHHAATELMMDTAPVTPCAGTERVTTSRFWPVIIREFAAFGLVLPAEGEALRRTFDATEFDDLFRPLFRNLADRLVIALPEARRAEVRAALIEPGSLKAQIEEAMQKRYPDEEAQKKAGRDLASFAASALGGYAVYGLFDSFDMRFRVEMPGRVLRTNGDLGKLPAVEWHLDKDGVDLVLVPPRLYAYSFSPAAGAAGAWDMAMITRIEGALAHLGPDARAAVEVVVAGVLAGGQKDVTGLDDASQAACQVLFDALDQVKPREGDGG